MQSPVDPVSISSATPTISLSPASRRRLLVEKVKPAVEKFLCERGLSLSEEKTIITYIKDGFTFLGQTFRKHGRKLHITPSKEGVLALVRKVGTIIRKHVSAPIPLLIKEAQPDSTRLGQLSSACCVIGDLQSH